MGKLFRRLSALAHRRRLQTELEEEMAAHREMMPAARRPHFGSTLRLREEAAEQWGWTWLDRLRQDLVYGLRSLGRSPGWALTAVAVLSLGIGVNVAELQMFQALLHRLHVRDLDSLCRFYRITREGTSVTFPVAAIDFYRRYNTVLAAVFSETDLGGVFQDEDAEDLRCNLVSGNFFGELGVAPAYGRLLNEQDDRPGAPPVAVLGFDYWRTRFGGDPGVVLTRIRLNGRPVQVVGIASPDFAGVVRQPARVWMPMSQYPYVMGGSRSVVDRTAMLGRLRPGVSREAAEAQFRSLAAELRQEQPQLVDRDEWLKVVAPDAMIAPKPGLILLMTTCVLLVLLVLAAACANLGNMLLARGLARQREIEIRLAIGAGRGRLIRQLMTENLLLAVVASVAALAVGRLAARLLLRIIEAPSNLRITTDWRTVLACAALGLLTTLAFGLAPAVQSVKPGPTATRARKILVSVQVAVCCVLLILSSYFTRAAARTFGAGVTFDYARMATVDPVLYLRRYTAAQARQAALEIAERLRQAPGIDAVAMATIPPLRRSRIEQAGGVQLYLNAVDPAYFALMRQPLVQGWIFGSNEPDAAVVSESAARRLWPNETAIGKSCLVSNRARTVTGVVKDSGVNLLGYPESVEVYTPIDDQNAIYSILLVHAASPAPLWPALRSAAAPVGSGTQLFPLESAIEQQRDTMRKTLAVVGSLGAIASLLALLGIFGLLAFTVAQRTREIGVRMALGARARDVLGCVLGQYAAPFGIGASAGIGLAAAAAKVLHNLLFGYMPLGLLSLGGGLLLFAVIAAAAAIAPARRALRIDPASSLRYE